MDKHCPTVSSQLPDKLKFHDELSTNGQVDLHQTICNTSLWQQDNVRKSYIDRHSCTKENTLAWIVIYRNDAPGCQSVTNGYSEIRDKQTRNIGRASRHAFDAEKLLKLCKTSNSVVGCQVRSPISNPGRCNIIIYQSLRLSTSLTGIRVMLIGVALQVSLLCISLWSYRTLHDFFHQSLRPLILNDLLQWGSLIHSPMLSAMTQCWWATNVIQVLTFTKITWKQKSPSQNEFRSVSTPSQQIHCNFDVQSCANSNSAGTKPVQVARGGSPLSYAEAAKASPQNPNGIRVSEPKDCPTDIYHEKQSGTDCQVHSLNAFFGGKVFIAEKVKAFVIDLQKKEPENVCLQQTYDPRYGYTDDAINLYLAANTTPMMRFATSTAPDIAIKIGTCMAEILQKLPGLCKRFIVKSTSLRNGIRRSHATCVKYSNITKTWYLIDSERPGPVGLDSHGWETLHGEIFLPYSVLRDNTSYVVNWEENLDGFWIEQSGGTICINDAKGAEIKKISLGTSIHRKDNRREVRSSVQAQTNKRNTARVHQQATHDNATKGQASSRKDSKQPTLKAFFDKQANPQVKLKSQENHCQPAQPTSCHHELSVPMDQYASPDTDLGAEDQIHEPTTDPNTTAPEEDNEKSNCDLEAMRAADTQEGKPEVQVIPGSVIKLLTWNVMGLTTVIDELRTMICEQDPDIVVLTETKLHKYNCNSSIMKSILQGYTLFHSCKAAPNPLRVKRKFRTRRKSGLQTRKETSTDADHLGRNGTGGVTLAVKNCWCSSGSVSLLSSANKDEFLTSHCVGIKLQPPHSDAILIWGVYMPFVDQTRRQIQAYLLNEMQNAPYSIMAGDWNAALFQTDRPDYDSLHEESCVNHNDIRDQTHAEFVERANLSAIDPPRTEIGERTRTFRSNQRDAVGSRIDDILLSKGMHSCKSHLSFPDSNGDSDHNPLLAEISLQDITLILPPAPLPEKPRTARFKTPMKAEELESYKAALEAETGPEITAIQLKLSTLVHRAQLKIMDAKLRGHNPLNAPSKNVLQDLTQEMLDLEDRLDQLMTGKVLQIAKSVLEMTKPTLKQHRFHRPRSIQNKLVKSAQMARWLRSTICIYESLLESRDHKSAGAKEADCIAQHKDFDPARMPQPPSHQIMEDGLVSQDWLDFMANVKGLAAIEKKERRNIRLDEAKKQRTKARPFVQRLFATKQKAANKMIKGANSNSKITALRDREGEIHCDPEGINRIVEQHFQNLANPINGCRTGRYSADRDRQNYPWSGMDSFKLQSNVHTADGRSQSPCILSLLKDKSGFLKRVRSLARNKAPGKDGIPNEILMNLPEDLPDALHSLCILRYLLGSTPARCKQSQTVLLFKKEDPLDIRNYRPIALADTMTKLYTGLLAECMTDFAEYHDILSSSQEGFRRDKGTARQLLMMQNVLSDAKIFGNDIYLMYVDFSSAFNTIDHDKLLIIMHDLGFPIDCIEAVKDLYTDAETEFILPNGNTAPIKIERGTIQGDSLSPLLFLIFLEPLLRWLHSGGRGYPMSSLRKEGTKISSLAYADDLCALTSCSADLAMQAKKIETFGKWGGLKVNIKKCAATGILYARCKKEASNAPLHTSMVSLLERQLKKVSIEDNPIPFLAPDKPYCYLGVEITACMDWRLQVQKMKDITFEKGAKVLASLLSHKQILQYIQTSIRPAIVYSFALGIYSAYDIHSLDSILIRIAKKALGLPLSTPSAMILKDRNKGGVGLTSLMVDYVQANTAYLSKALNDKGPLGQSTKALLEAEKACIGNIPTLETGLQDKRFLKFIRHFHIMNRVSLIRCSGLFIQTPDKEVLAALGTNLETLSNVVDLNGVNIPSRIYVPLMEIGLLDLHQCIQTEQKAECFLPASNLKHHTKDRVRPRHKIAINRLALLLSEGGSTLNALEYKSCADLPWEARKVAPSLASGKERCLSDQQQMMWDWANQNLPERTPDNEDGGLFEEQRRRGALAHNFTKNKKRKFYNRPEENQKREAKDDNISKRFEKYLEQSRSKRQKASGPSPRMGECQSGNEYGLSGEDLCKLIDQARSEQETYKSNRCNVPPSGLKRLDDFVKWIALACKKPDYIVCLYGPQERLQKVLHPEMKEGQKGFVVRWHPTTILYKHIESYKILDYTVQNLEPIENGRTGPYDWVRVSWNPRFEPEEVLGRSDHTIKLIKDMEQRMMAVANRVHAQALCHPRKDKDITDNMAIQGNWIPRETRCPHPLLNEPWLQKKIVLDPMNKVNPDKDVPATGAFEVYYITERQYAIYAPNGLYQGTMNTERLQLLYQAYSKPAIFNSGQFPEAVAKLLRRYKDGHKSQTYKTVHKYQIATPKLVLRALTNAFQITTELFASPLNFSSESTVYCSPYAEDTEFGAHHDAYSFLWKGSCFCHPEGSDEQLRRSMQWAIACAQLHSEPLVVTFLLPDRPKSAFTSLLNHHMAKKLGTFSARTMGFQNGNSYATANQETTHMKHSSVLLTIGNKEGYTRYFSQEKQSALEVALLRLQTPLQRPGRQQAHTQSAANSTVAPPKRLRRIVEGKETCSPITWVQSPNRQSADLVQAKPMPEPRLQASSIWYTDGSKQTSQDGANVTGSGVYNSDQHVSMAINCHGRAATNTITRAELAAIAAAIEEMGANQNEIIATDSQASICMIAKYLHTPQSLQQCKHKAILEDIVLKLLQRARVGLITEIVKVKSHIGIMGNEAADKLATTATDPLACTHDYNKGSNGLEGSYWPCHNVESKNKDGSTRTDVWLVGNLTSAIKAIASPSCQSGNTNDTLYVDLWKQIEHKVLPNSLEHPWTSRIVTASILRNTLKARYGQLWNMNMAFVRKMPYMKHLCVARSNACPLCSFEDSGSHILGGCRHKDMTKAYIERHNEAGRLIFKAIRDGTMGNNTFIADLGTKTHMQEMGALDTRLPPWLACESTIKDYSDKAQGVHDIMEHGIIFNEDQRAELKSQFSTGVFAPEDRLKLRPDILMTDMTTDEIKTAEADFARQQRKRKADKNPPTRSQDVIKGQKITIVEIGYVADTRYEDKLSNKFDQHKMLCRLLALEGHEVQILPIILGTQGAVFECFPKAMTALGVSKSNQMTLARRLSDHALLSLSKIIKSRRHLEYTALGPKAKKPPDKHQSCATDLHT